MNQRIRMAGESPEIERLLLADKYRYLERGDYPAPAELAYEERVDDVADPEAYLAALEGRELAFQQHEAAIDRYEQSVVQRIGELRQQFPDLSSVELLGLALRLPAQP